MFYVYVLESNLNHTLYIGSTKDLRERFKKHNEGKVFSTKRYKPWRLIYYEAYIHEELARMREQKLKHHGNALRHLKNRIVKMKVKNSAGFTLVEIIVVIALIGILGTWMISLVDPGAQFRKGRDAERKAELAQLQAALELYRADKGEYPSQPLPDCNSSLEDGSTVYIQKIPCDPDKSSYFYSRPQPSSYTLVACLENLRDLNLDQVNDPSCEADRWSYTVTNP